MWIKTFILIIEKGTKRVRGEWFILAKEDIFELEKVLNT